MIYLDNHATTPCDPRVVQAMVSILSHQFGNPHSVSHSIGREAADIVRRSTDSVGNLLGVAPDSILYTSGATESINLAIDGVCRHPRQKRRHVVTSAAEHPAVLDVCARLEKDGFRVTRVPLIGQDHVSAGMVDLKKLEAALDSDTAIVSIHWANNEIGTIQPIERIAKLAHRVGALFHSDATQAVGRIPINLTESDVDLLSASAHKFYGPKGIGILSYGGGVEKRRVRLMPAIVGGGQQGNLRSGTLAPANVYAFASALQYAVKEQADTRERIGILRQTLFDQLCGAIDGLALNGPPIEDDQRLVENLNLRLPDVEGEAWMAATPGVAFSSGSACSSVEARPSHVLTALGLSEGEARRSVRFGIGKFNDLEEIQRAVQDLIAGYQKVQRG